MPLYDFDKIINRNDTNSIKYDFSRERGMPQGLTPLWVADMDFQTPAEVIDRLVETARHGIFGYAEAKESYYKAVQGWFQRRFDFSPQPEWMVKAPGVVYSLAVAIRAFTSPGDAVVVQTPVYYPFFRMIKENDRRVTDSSLIYKDGAYQMDFADLEKRIVQENAKMLLLCSPHNPVGRVWTKEELAELARICLKTRCLVVSDEIHCDFVFGRRTHHVLTTIEPALEEITVVLTAPSKTFNLAGLQCSNAVIPNPELRKRFKDEISRTGVSQLNVMGLVAAQTAYERGEDWLDQLLAYLEESVSTTKQFFRERLPQVRLVEPEGTYLLWLDFSSLNLTDSELNRLVIDRAGLWLDEGVMFGQAGSGFQRVNMACPRSVLFSAWERLEKAING
ncbi:MAG: pyridoxal phosphate-dependent aminotransferase [Deltaproteobacteria bacterium]|jgi:cystathionine beta-lyase|nr:pyridoxal phosphate-dependent aminotransferase [Deltaproteobacteria bacterium]